LSTIAPKWSWTHAATGLQALDLLTRSSYDAVVADHGLTDLSGLQILNQVLSQWPRTQRVMLADLGDLETLLRCVGGPHQFLARPAEAQRLLTVLARAFKLDLWLPNQAVRKLLGRLPALPSTSGDYHAIVEALQSGDLDQAADRIAADPPLAAKTLQLANSAVWGPPLDEAHPGRCARELGLSNLRSLLLLSHTYSAYRDLAGTGFDVATFVAHARQTSQLSRRIAETEEAVNDSLADQAAGAGLLHNLGKLALAVNLPDKYRQVQAFRAERRMSSWEAEQVVFGATHGEVGASLLALWGLPMPVIEAVAFHHHPTCLLTSTFSPLTAVHVAVAFLSCPSLELARQKIDIGYLATVQVDHQLERWWACRMDLPEAPQPT
jgi:HD-like signal output (HDOD) protein